ncbi:MAG: M28 family peptidase [Bacteroidales bacterium]|nr:M28 family peptidase [Bacteroidales bacterium]
MKKIFCLMTIVLMSVSMFSQTNEELTQMLAELNSDSIQATMLELQQYQRCAFFNNRDAAQYLVGKMQQYGLQNVRIDSFYTWLYDAHIYNVRGTIPGSLSPDSVVLVGAHYDKLTVGTTGDTLMTTLGGADNNAAGVALILEVARVLNNHQFSPRTTVEFIALDANEISMLGSDMDAVDRSSHQEYVKLMLNNDRIAYDPQNMHMMTILWYENAMQERSDAALMFESFSQLMPVMMDVAGNLPESQEVDAYSYSRYGFPAVSFRETTLSPYHHTENDLMETCNLSNVVELAKVNMTMIIHYAYHDVFSLPDGVASYSQKLLEVKPNPTTDLVWLDLTDMADEVMVDVISAQGQVLSHQIVSASNPTISMCSLPSGFYFLKVYDGNKSIGTSKIIKW